MAETKTPIISFRNFSFQYRAQKQPTLHDIDLDIYPGERVLIAGPSGSGKSTLAACINGLNPFSNPGECKGSLIVDGVDAPHSSIFELAGHVGTVLQDPDGQFIGLTVGEDIAFALENSCTPQEEMHEITRRAAELVGIENHLDYAPHELSGGQKQRVSLAGVMVDQVKVLLFDEPLANLDPATGKQAIELIDTIQQKTDTTVLIIEHRLEDVLWRSVDRIVLVNDGRILADLHPDELLSGSLLAENGIREPLYLTAMRYAGIDITPEKHPAHIDSVALDDADTARLQTWFKAEPLPAPKPTPAPLLEVKNLSFGYSKDQHTLSDVSFTIGRGEMVSIVGRNGAGKSTLSKLICGFETPDRGEIWFDGKNLKGENIRRRARHIGYVMQNPNQMISKTMIFDEVAMGLQGIGLSEDEIRARVEETLRVCGLYPFRNWPISALSFGQKKRVTIASVLVQHPELIILDEPTAGQDFRHYTDIMEFLRGLNAKGVTVVDKSGFVTMSQRMPQEMKAHGLLTDDGSYISLPGGGGENYGEILFRQLSPEFLFNDRGHVYLGSTFAATRTPSSHATVRKTGFTIVHPTQTINLAMLGIVDWNNDEKDEWLIACDVRPHLGSESRTYYVLVPPPLRKGEPLQATVAAVYECYGLACKLTVRDSRAIPRVGEGELPPTDVHDALPGMEGVTEPPRPDSTPRSGLQERSL